ncbi:phosphoenolpyruvate carboxylase [Tanacetum coccineum]
MSTRFALGIVCKIQFLHEKEINELKDSTEAGKEKIYTTTSERMQILHLEISVIWFLISFNPICQAAAKKRRYKVPPINEMQKRSQETIMDDFFLTGLNACNVQEKKEMICDCLAQFYAKDVIPDDKQEVDDALHREIQVAFRTDEIRRTLTTPQVEMRVGMSYFHLYAAKEKIVVAKAEADARCTTERVSVEWSKATEAVERRNEMLKRLNFGFCFVFGNKLSKKRSVKSNLKTSDDKMGGMVGLVKWVVVVTAFDHKSVAKHLLESDPTPATIEVLIPYFYTPTKITEMDQETLPLMPSWTKPQSLKDQPAVKYTLQSDQKNWTAERYLEEAKPTTKEEAKPTKEETEPVAK